MNNTPSPTVLCKLCNTDAPRGYSHAGYPLPICKECKQKEDNALLGQFKVTAETLKRFFPQ